MKIQKVVFCILFSLILLTIMFWYLQNLSDKTIVKADAPVVASATRVVEAENCLAGTESGCSTEEFWKLWVISDSSRLITNEHPVTLGLSLPAMLTLSFTGTGVSIVYRQDSWYGTLGVKIDQPEYLIQQKGIVKNQVETCFEAKGVSPHTLILNGGQSTGLITGVITIDAIKIFDENEPCGTKKALCNRGIIAPAYFDPDSPQGTIYWKQLAEAAQKINNRLVVIANVANGPGLTRTITYTNAISQVVSNGGKVIGYVYTCYGNQTEPDPERPLCPRTEASIQQDVNRWYEFYPMMSGIFFDEVSTAQDKASYYQELYNYVLQGKQANAIVVFNFGVEPHQDYLSIGSSILCTFEGPFSSFAGWQPPSWITREQSCALVYDTSSANLPPALEYLKPKNVGWFYLTDDTLPNPWDTLPPYFDDLINRVSCAVYLPIVYKNK